jgi:signal transduction histidine kinase
MNGYGPAAALLALDGTIILVSEAWKLLAETRGGEWLMPGENYLDMIGHERLGRRPESLAIVSALLELMAGKRMRSETILSCDPEGTAGMHRLVMSAMTFGDEHYVLVERLADSQPARNGHRPAVVDGRLLRAQEEERRRIARDLHDSTSQLLVGLQFSLSQLKQSPLSAELSPVLSDCEAALSAIQKEIRTVSYLCHPPLLGSRTLATALDSMTRGFAQRAGLGVSIALDDIGEISPSVEATFYRLAQEALANIHRHAKASMIVLRLTAKRDYIHLVIEDDGVGFELDSGKSTPGVGIAGMQERVEEMAGRLSIRQGGLGTSVRASIPRRRRNPAILLEGGGPEPKTPWCASAKDQVDSHKEPTGRSGIDLKIAPSRWNHRSSTR